MNKNKLALFTLLLFLIGCRGGDDKTKPGGGAVVTTPIIKPTVNFYLENSGSMFGYVTDGSGNDFDRSLSSLLTQMTVSGYTDSL